MNKLKSMGKRDLIFLTIVHFTVLVISVVILYALWFVVIASISNPNLVASGEVLFWPKGVTFEGYKYILRDKRIWTGYRNTILYTTVGTLLGLFITIPAGYALSRKDVVGRSIIMKLLLFTKFFSGGLIPTYLVVKRLHLVDTPYVLMILGSFSVFNLILCRTFFINTLPQELQEAAEIDGCSIFQYFIAFFNGLIYVTNNKLYPLQVILRDILISGQSVDPSIIDPESLDLMKQIARTIKYGVIIVSSLPVLIMYPFVQKYFVKGVMIGSVKG